MKRIIDVPALRRIIQGQQTHLYDAYGPDTVDKDTLATNGACWRALEAMPYWSVFCLYAEDAPPDETVP